MNSPQHEPLNKEILNIHHHAFRCRNAEETRHFYEDVLGMRMTAAIVMPSHPLSGALTPYCHIFFELGDGNTIAFFDSPRAFRAKEFTVVDGLDHHVALKTPDDASMKSIERRLHAAGVKTEFHDHAVFHSMYFNDPNGLNLEIICDTPLTADAEHSAAQTARQDLASWMAARDQ